MSKIHVLVVYQFTIDNTDLEVVVVILGPHSEQWRCPVSRIFTIPDAAPHAAGNPYGVYGDVVEKFTGRDKNTIGITVARCTSGELNTFCACQVCRNSDAK